MSELEDAVQRLDYIRWVTNMANSTGYYTLRPFNNGDLVIIDLLGVSVDGVQVESDHVVMGEIKDNTNGLMTVSGASNSLHQESLVGTDIGLGCHLRLMSPGGLVSVDLKGGVKPKSEALYYFPVDIEPTSKFDIPSTYHPFFGRFGRITVADQVLFDEMPLAA